LTSAANLNGTVSFVYDKLRRVTSTTDVWGQAISYVYDVNGRRTQMSLGSTKFATYTYDSINRLTKITDSAGKSTSYTFDAASNLLTRTLSNSVVSTYSYDGMNRVTRLKDAKSTTVIADNNYTYNDANQIVQNLDQSGTHLYGYDALNRLTSASYPATGNETYAYDGVGNRTSSHRSASYSYQPNNRLTNTDTATYLYDNNGNMTAKSDGSGTTQLVWDFENRLTQAVTPSAGNVTYKYDALGRRIQRVPSTGASTNFIYDCQDIVRDKSSDATSVDYLNGPGVDKKIWQKGAAQYFFSHDHLGSTTALTNTSGILIERETYDAYGNSTGSALTRYGYTGRERDSLTGLLHYRARSYDPQLGRFISEDPIRFGGSINWYDYVDNSPVAWIDPFGWAKFYYWANDRNSKYGHSALVLDDGTYISYWPTCYFGKDPQLFKHCPARPSNYDQDVEGEGNRKPKSIQVDGLDEEAIKRWWDDGKGHGDFSLWNNCSDIVGEALRVGGLPIRKTSVYSTPDYVKDEIERLLHDRQYPPPVPKPAPAPTPCRTGCR
jgi:RHS repeat-associated protein